MTLYTVPDQEGDKLIKIFTFIKSISGTWEIVSYIAEVTILLSASFLGTLAHVLGTRPLVSFLALVRRLLIELCIGFFLGT
jgi:hypothetical protein